MKILDRIFNRNKGPLHGVKFKCGDNTETFTITDDGKSNENGEELVVITWDDGKTGRTRYDRAFVNGLFETGEYVKITD